MNRIPYINHVPQERGDVSRRPLKIACGKLAESEGIDPDEGWETVKVYGMNGTGTPTDEDHLKGKFDGQGYSKGNNTDADVPILLGLTATDTTTFPGNQITLVFDGGDEIDIYVPSLTFTGEETYLLWVAEDGSTYWARVNEDGTHDGNTVNQSALYAMQYDEDGLACCAYDARLYRYGAQSMAQSPAIDKGTDDAYGYDSTSTNPKVIDMGQPDIGYHYYRRVADDDPVNDQLIEFTFQQPKISDGREISRYIVMDPADSENPPIHFISQENLYYPGTQIISQEGFSGKDVVLGRLEDKEIEKGDYSLDLKTEIGDQQSVPASVRLVIDPDPPTIQIGE